MTAEPAMTNHQHIETGGPMRSDEATLPEGIPVVEMVGPLLGFPDHRRFALTRMDDTGVVCALRSLDEPDLRFLVVPPAAFFAEYTPELDDATAAALGASSGDDLLTLVLVTSGDAPLSATANLLAPVVVNHRTRRGAQVVLHDENLSLRAPLMPVRPDHQ